MLQRATDAKTKSDEAQISERVRLAYHTALTRDLTNGNGVLTKETLDEEINNEFGTDGSVTENDDYFIISVKGNEIEKIAKTKNAPETPSDNLLVLKAKIAEESGNCMIDENGTIMPIGTWNYIPTGEDTCKLEGYYDEDNDENLNAYKGEQPDAYSFKYELPVFVKVGNTIYKVNELGADALAYYGNINNTILIPRSIEIIGPSAFQCNANITSITIPDTVTSISNLAFNNCLAITSITIPSTVTSMGGEVFRVWTASQTINVSFKEGEKPDGWRDDWNLNCNAQINYAN